MKKILLALLPIFLFVQQPLFADTLIFTDNLRVGVDLPSTLSNSVIVSSGSVLKVSGTLNFAPDPSAVSVRQSFAFGNEDDGFNPEQILHVEAGAALIIGDVETGDLGALVISENTLLIIEQGAFLQIADGSSLLIEYGGGIIIESGVEFDFWGNHALVVNTCNICLPYHDIAIFPPAHCAPESMICEDEQPFDPWIPPVIPPNPPQPPVNPYPSMVADNDLEFVNTLVGIVGTTPTGALTYTIPITVPVGTAGMQPQLAIVYNSQNNSNGILGLGFGLSGLSSISRIGRNFYHDNERTGVTLTMNDHFALDGQRLIRTGGNTAIGTDGVIYDTEIASFSEITSSGHGETALAFGSFVFSRFLGPREFQVTTKDGSILHYGGSGNCNSMVTNFDQYFNTVISQWYISRMEDPNGNFIEYLYHPNNIDQGWANQIREIRYGHTTGETPLNRIVFSYIDRPVQNRRTLYLAGNPIPEQKLLSEIRIYSNNSLVKRYSFHYTTDRQRLIHMRKFAPNGRILGELRFDWSQPQQRFANPVHWVSEFGSNAGSWRNNRHVRKLASVNGDGKMDIVGFGEENVFVGRSTGSSFEFETWLPSALTIGHGNWRPDRYSRHVADMNGDGIADLIGFGYYGVYVATSNGSNAFGSVNRWITGFGGRTGWSNIRRYPRHLADFNGDGLPDIIGHGGDNTYIALNTGNNFHGGVIAAPVFRGRDLNFGGIETRRSYSLVGDINGDGRADIVVFRYRQSYETNSHCNLGMWCWMKYYTVYIALSDGTSLQNLGQAFRTDRMRRDSRFNHFLADVNGDGLADLIFTGRNGMYVALSTGTGFTTPTRWLSQLGSRTVFSNPVAPYNAYKLVMADVNGDGMADLIVFDGISVFVFLSTGTGFSAPTAWTTDYWGSFFPRWRDNANNFRTIADVNGDGLPDLIGFDSDGVWVSLNLSGQPMLIGVTDNLGRQFTAEYDFLTNSAIYTKGPAKPFPLMSYQGPIRVCTRLTTRSSDKQFRYEGAVIHQQGRGFLGFSRITEINTTLQLRQVTESELNQEFFIKLPRRTEVFSTVNNQRLSENIQTNRIRHLGGRRILNEVSQTVSRDFLTNVEQITRLEYDGFGNILSNITTRGTIGAQPLARFVTRSTYTVSAGRTIPNRLATTVSYNYYTATPSQRFTNTVHFTYDTRGNLTRTIDRQGTSIARTTDYVINTRGLVTQVTVSAPGVSTQTQRFGYDPHFRFQTSQETVGLGTSHRMFDSFGRILTETAIGGQTTTYQYDAFGRLNRVTSPEGFVTTHTIRRERNMPGVVYVSEVSRPGRPTIRTFLDILGRTVRTETYNPSGMVITRTEFNNRGQVTRTSMPHFANETPRWTTFAYDNFGRLISETFEGLTTTYAYNGLTTTVTPPAGTAQRTTRTHNAAGDLIRATDAGGTINYQHFAPGFVNRITTPGNAVTTIEYDAFGRQIALHDPNAGRITFSYDAFDRIVSQTNARGYTTTNTYDNFGRLATVTEAGNRITTYTYITSGPNIGRLQSISVNNGTAHIFEYDQFGRITQFRDVSQSFTLITEYTYDEFGNLATYRFPSLYRLHYTYNNGFKTHIRENNSAGRVIWELGSVNAMGQELSSTVLGRSKTQTYNVFGQPTRMTLEGLMDYTYTYDLRTGNMLSRRNPFNGQNETFTYDALNRLTTGVTFSPCGNILSKEGVGNFIYDPVRRHAVERIEGALGLRDHLDHDITYTSFQKVYTITAPNNIVVSHVNFAYGPNRQRQRMNIFYGESVLTKHYTQNFETSSINTKEYIFSPFGLVAIRNNGFLNAVATDHLGSIVAKYNPSRWRYEHFGFTPWGRRYRYEHGTKFFFDENLPRSINEFLDYFARGFTGHEHLDLLGLINMNGRLYDPTIGRFLSPDPFVPDATFTQDFNRYMYARNNPLSYIDPDGEFVVSLLIGAAISGTIGYISGKRAGLSGSDLFFYTFASATIGAISGGIGSAVGAGVASSLTISGFAGGFVAGAAGGAAGGFTAGLFTTGLNNSMLGKNDNVFLGGLKGGALGALGGGISGGISGGFRAWRDGRSIWDGATDVVRFDVPNVGNRLPNDCVPTTLAEANTFFGGDISYEDWLRISGYQDGQGVIGSRRALHSLITDNFQTGDFDVSNLRNPGVMREIQRGGNLITVHRPMGFTQNGLPMTHLDNIRSVRFFQNGTVIVRDRLGSFRPPQNTDGWFFFRLLSTR